MTANNEHMILIEEKLDILNLAIGKFNVDTERLFTALRQLNDRRINKILGPTPQEQMASEKRLEILDILSPLCDFGSDNVSPDIVNSRKSYNTILDIQSHYESKYF